MNVDREGLGFCSICLDDWLKKEKRKKEEYGDVLIDGGVLLRSYFSLSFLELLF